jgi:hypothetical protein
MTAQPLYRLSWEMVDLSKLGLYSNADPALYKNTTQVVPNSEIPDEHWHPVQRQDAQPWEQYRTLKGWADADTGFVRNVQLELRVDEPRWQALDDPATCPCQGTGAIVTRPAEFGPDDPHPEEAEPCGCPVAFEKGYRP